MSSGQAAASTYFVSPSGNDNNNGSQSSPFKTFEKSISVLNPGDELKLNPGIYNEQLRLNKSGNANNWITISTTSGRPVVNGNFNFQPLLITGDYIKVIGLEIQKGKNPGETDGYCADIDISSQNIILDNLDIHDCKGHGINIDGQNITMQNSKVYNTNLAFAHTGQSSMWGSGIKGHHGAENVTIKNNTVYNNYGEGIAMTRVVGSIIENNTAYDNFGVNIYIDNSPNSIVRNNFSYYTSNSEYYKDGKKGRCIELAEEHYTGWGAQMNNVEVYNNIATDCYYGITFFDGGQSGAAIKNINIHNNLLWNIDKTGTSIDPLPTQGTNQYYKNIVYSKRGVDIWTDLTSGINFNTNLWVSGEPGPNIANGSGDQYGQPEFFSSPSLTNPESYKLKTSSAAFQAGIGPFQSGFSSVIGASANVISSPTPTPTPTPSPSPTPTIEPSPTPIATPSPSVSPSPISCSEDINLDGVVNIKDYTILVTDFFSTNPINPRSDISGDNKINLLDYSLLSGRFFDNC
ncbi:MAG: right-handed parallel beta-helix repeat-containing protein [Candidatus Pacebacteria bacterium]|nr:right-handed parallel beta-helix repeat-containing protein [Candidatus Paceibacterota bacterium]